MRQMFNARSGADAEEPRFYSVEQVAGLFGVSAMTLYRAIGNHEFPAIRIRGRLIVPAKAIDAMVEAALERNTAVDATEFATGAAA